MKLSKPECCERESTDLNTELKRFGYTLTNTFQAKTSYIHRKITGRDVLISVGENIANFNGYIELNESAAILWDSMKEPCTVPSLIHTIEESFDIEKSQAANDVLEFLKMLQEHEMIVIGEE